jgi:hypothetical protein
MLAVVLRGAHNLGPRSIGMVLGWEVILGLEPFTSLNRPIQPLPEKSTTPYHKDPSLRERTNTTLQHVASL